MYDPATDDIGVVNMVVVKRMKENALASPSGISNVSLIRHLRALLANVR